MQKIKKGLALLCVFMLAAFPAGANTQDAFYEWVMHREAEAGASGEWSVDEQIELVSQMLTYGLVQQNPRLTRLLETSLDEAEARSLVEQIVQETFGLPLSSLSHVTMLTVEKGPYNSWSLEEKAWYAKMLVELGVEAPDQMIHILPREGDLTEAEALAAARAYLQTLYDLSDEILEGYTAYAFYYAYRDAPSQPEWSILFQATEGQTLPALNVTMGADGADPQELLNPAGLAEAAQAGEEGTASGQALSMDTALSIGRSHLLSEQGLSDQDLARYTILPILVPQSGEDLPAHWKIEYLLQEEDPESHAASQFTLWINAETGEIIEGGERP